MSPGWFAPEVIGTWCVSLKLNYVTLLQITGYIHIFIIKNNNCCIAFVSRLYRVCTVIEPWLNRDWTLIEPWLNRRYVTLLPITSPLLPRHIQGSFKEHLSDWSVTSSSHSITFRKRFETNEVLLLILTNYLFKLFRK